jgi:hypothetical protein
VAGDQLVNDALGPPVLEEGPTHLRLVVPLLLLQIAREAPKVVVYVFRGEESLEGTPGREGDRVGEPLRDLVEEVHRAKGLVLEGRVQLRRVQQSLWIPLCHRRSTPS